MSGANTPAGREFVAAYSEHLAKTSKGFRFGEIATVISNQEMKDPVFMAVMESVSSSRDFVPLVKNSKLGNPALQDSSSVDDISAPASGALFVFRILKHMTVGDRYDGQAAREKWIEFEENENLREGERMLDYNVDFNSRYRFKRHDPKDPNYSKCYMGYLMEDWNRALFLFAYVHFSLQKPWELYSTKRAIKMNFMTFKDSADAEAEAEHHQSEVQEEIEKRKKLIDVFYKLGANKDSRSGQESKFTETLNKIVRSRSSGTQETFSYDESKAELSSLLEKITAYSALSSNPHIASDLNNPRTYKPVDVATIKVA